VTGRGTYARRERQYQQMAKKTPWPVIVLGIGAFALIVGAGLIAVAGYFVYQQFAIQATAATEEDAAQEFALAASRFQGQKPYLAIKDGEPIVSNDRPAKPGEPIDAIHILVWDPDQGRVVRFNVPLWLLRMSKGHPIKIQHDGDEAPVRLKLTAADLEKRGPGLILDHKDAGGQRILVWAQ